MIILLILNNTNQVQKDSSGDDFLMNSVIRTAANEWGGAVFGSVLVWTDLSPVA